MIVTSRSGVDLTGKKTRVPLRGTVSSGGRPDGSGKQGGIVLEKSQDQRRDRRGEKTSGR